MQALLLNQSTKALLTNAKGILCDMGGNALALGVPPIPVYRDQYSGDVYARIAEVIPTATDAASIEAAKEITEQDPIHYVSEDGTLKGWFVEVPNFTPTEK